MFETLIPVGLTGLVLWYVYAQKDKIHVGDEVIVPEKAFGQLPIQGAIATVGLRVDGQDKDTVSGPIVAYYGVNGERLQFPATVGPFQVRKNQIIRRIPAAKRV